MTGAGRGIGSAIALAYAGEGALLTLVGRTKTELEATAVKCEQTPGAALQMADCVVIDLSTPEGVDELVNHVEAIKGCDVLVNNAGCMLPGNATVGELADMDRMMFLNLQVPMKLTRKFAPRMVDQQWGLIVNVGSIAGIEPMSGEAAAYAATKHGLRGWSTSIYNSLRESNVKVVLINPAYVNTQMVNRDEDLIPERMIQPADVAEVAMLPLRTTSACVPTEITLRLTLKATK